MKRVIIWSIALQSVNALIVALCHKSIMALLFSVPIGMAMAWIIGDALENRRINTRHHGAGVYPFFDRQSASHPDK